MRVHEIVSGELHEIVSGALHEIVSGALHEVVSGALFLIPTHCNLFIQQKKTQVVVLRLLVTMSYSYSIYIV